MPQMVLKQESLKSIPSLKNKEGKELSRIFNKSDKSHNNDTMAQGIE